MLAVSCVWFVKGNGDTIIMGDDRARLDQQLRVYLERDCGGRVNSASRNHGTGSCPVLATCCQCGALLTYGSAKGGVIFLSPDHMASTRDELGRSMIVEAHTGVYKFRSWKFACQQGRTNLGARMCSLGVRSNERGSVHGNMSRGIIWSGPFERLDCDGDPVRFLRAGAQLTR